MKIRKTDESKLPMKRPILACCNFLSTTADLKEFAQEHGFSGIDWTFTAENMPASPAAEAELAEGIASLAPSEVRDLEQRFA